MTEERLPLAGLLAKAGNGDFLCFVAEAAAPLADRDGRGRLDRRRAARVRWRLHDASQRLSRPHAGHAAWASCGSECPSRGKAAFGCRPWSRAGRLRKPWRPRSGRLWVGGVSIRRLGDLVQAMGPAGIGKSTVSKPGKDIDGRVNAFRPPAGGLPLSVAVCCLPQAARWWANRQRRRDDRHGSDLGRARVGSRQRSARSWARLGKDAACAGCAMLSSTSQKPGKT